MIGLTRILGILTVLMGCMLSSGRTAPAKLSPYVVFWCKKPEGLKHATLITPQVWVEKDTRARKRYPSYPAQDYWLKKDILPLAWKAGYCDRDKSKEELAADWILAWKQGYRGIAIDEFGFDQGGPVDRKMAWALRETRRQAPDLFIACWQTQGLSDELFKAYAEVADLVMVECYYDGKKYEKKFAAVVNRVRKAGIESKTILALGMNDEAPEEDQRTQGRWANSEEELEDQVRWLRKNAPEMPGVAFFAPSSSDKLVRFADTLCAKYFPRKAAESRRKD